MKKLLLLVSSLMFVTSMGFAQIEINIEDLADRLTIMAEQIAETAERNAARMEALAEKNAAKWEAEAERLAERFERKWNKDRKIRIEVGPRHRRWTSTSEGVFLGVEAYEISKEKARRLGFENPYGSYVSRVIENSSAKAAGLQPFDYIYGVNEQRTSDNQNLSDILEDYEAGDEVTLHFIRKGQQMTAQVRLGSFESGSWEDENHKEHGFFGVSPHEDENDEDQDGVSVEIVEASTAEEAGLKNGDVITRINGYPILDWDDVTTAISNTVPGDPVEVNFLRNGKEMQGKGLVKSSAGEENWNLDIDWDEMGDFDPQIDGLDNSQQSEDRAFLGVYVEIISESKASKLGFDNPYGTYVSGVMKNTAAEKAGIKALDYIYGIDEYRVGENQNLGGILKKFKPGDKATVHFLRKGKKMSSPIVFSKPSDAQKVSPNKCETSFLGITQSGAIEEDGIRVNPVENSTASELGFKNGDILTHINGYRMVDWTDVSAAISSMRPGETITVEYIRDGKKMKGSGSIKSYAEAKKCKDCDCGSKEDVVIKIDEPINLDFKWKDERTKTAEAAPPRIDVSKAKVEMDNVASGDEAVLRSKGVNIPQNNTLSVEKLRLTPNPANGLFTLDFNLPSNGKTIVKIFNAAGRGIYEYDLGRFSGDFSDAVDISQNGSGSYFLQITQDDRVFTKKIVLTNK